MLFVIAAVLFFFAGVGVTGIPNPVTWGLFALALGLAFGGPPLTYFWRRSPP